MTVTSSIEAQEIIAAQLTEAMTFPLVDAFDEDEIMFQEAIAGIHGSGIRFNALVMGPGMGTERWLGDVIIELISDFDYPVV
ncbi:hypothetical protein ACQZV8_18985, partial [Magnetococcales bacterium HHB-1]